MKSPEGRRREFVVVVGHMKTGGRDNERKTKGSKKVISEFLKYF